MTLILQVSWDLDGKHELHQMKVEKALAPFGLLPGDCGAGFGRRDMEFYFTKNLTEQEYRLMHLDLDQLKGYSGIPGFEHSEPYDDTEAFDDYFLTDGDR